MRLLLAALRFLTFHVLSVFTTVFMMMVLYDLIAIFISRQPASWIETGPDLIVIGVISIFFSGLLLVPSALGWQACRMLLDRMGDPVKDRPAIQGSAAGLAAFVSFVIFWLWLHHLNGQNRGGGDNPVTMDDLTPLISLFLLGMPATIFFARLIYRKLWPNLPATNRAPPAFRAREDCLSRSDR